MYNFDSSNNTIDFIYHNKYIVYLDSSNNTIGTFGNLYRFIDGSIYHLGMDKISKIDFIQLLIKHTGETVRWFRVTPDSDDKFQFARDKITRAIANRTFDVAKLDLYGQGLESCGTRQRIEQIEWIIKVGGAH